MERNKEKKKNDKKKHKRRKHHKVKSSSRKNHTCLTEVVRTEYMNHLKESLVENIKIYHAGKYNTAKMNGDLEKVDSCVNQLEQKALKSCMLAKIYQKCMRRTINKVLKKSAKNRLAKPLTETCTAIEDLLQRSKNQAVQTCEKLSNSTDLNVENPPPTSHVAEPNLCHNLEHTFRHYNGNSHTTLDYSIFDIPLPQNTKNNRIIDSVTVGAEENAEEDEVAKGLEKLFGEEQGDWDDFLGTQKTENDDPHIQSILREIEQANLNHNVGVPNTNNKLLIKRKPLSQSLWPCELYMQRKRLNESIDRRVDEDMRWYDIIKWRFNLLFGEDSDDELAMCSPSIELDKVLLGSCQERIKPWVIKHLMPAMRDGLIANRYLFKELARKLSRSIIQDNQYPDESYIKNAVGVFFCLHPSVVSIEDLMHISQISFTQDS